jgi:hypothetical protein
MVIPKIKLIKMSSWWLIFVLISLVINESVVNIKLRSYCSRNWLKLRLSYFSQWKRWSKFLCLINSASVVFEFVCLIDLLCCCCILFKFYQCLGAAIAAAMNILFCIICINSFTLFKNRNTFCY